MAEEEQVQPVPAQPKQPKPRFGFDEQGDPVEAPATGLMMDPETGQAVIPPEEAAKEPPASKAREATEKPPEKPPAAR